MNDHYMKVSWSYAAAHILILDQLGFPKQTAYEILGVDEDSPPNSAQRLEAAQLNKVFDHAEKALNDPFISLRVGYEFRISNFGKTGNVYSFCKDLSEVLVLNRRYQPLAVDIGEISTIVEPDEITGKARYFLDYDLYCEDFHAVRHVFNLVFAAYATAFRWLTWSSAYELKAIHFRQGPLVNEDLLDKIFQCPVFFNQAYNRIEFFEESMSAQLSTYDPLRKAQMMAQLDDYMASQDANDSFKHSLRMTIEDAILRGASNQAYIQQCLGLSDSQFRHKLKQADIKYRPFLDNVRQDLFTQKFMQGLNLAQIAQELGYNDQAAFNRAFKRWHGVSPSQFIKNNVDKRSV